VTENRYEQYTPGEKTTRKFSDIIVKGIMVPGRASGDFSCEAGGKEPLQMVMHKKDIEVFGPCLMPQGDKPGKCHNEKNEKTKPEPHLEDFSQVSFKREKSEDA
jgi:hypothetical protein